MRVLPRLRKRSARPRLPLRKRLLRIAGIGIIAVEVLLLTALVSPQSRGFAVAITTYPFFETWATTSFQMAVQNLVTAITQTNPQQIDQLLRDDFDDIDETVEEQLAIMQDDQVDLPGTADAWLDLDFPTLIEAPVTEFESDAYGGYDADGNPVLGTGLAYTDAGTTDRMRRLMPGYVEWDKYYYEYQGSADTTMNTLRAAMASLNKHYETIRDQSRLEDLIAAAEDPHGQREMDQIQFMATIEMNRQLQALREQLATQANMYAVTEAHRVGTEAREVAEKEANYLAACAKVALPASICAMLVPGL